MNKKNKPFLIILGVLLCLMMTFLFLNKLILIPTLTLIGLAFVQNTSFSMVSRSRNRDNMNYHAIASLLSNTLWFLTMRELFKQELDIFLFAPYALGTISGSVFGAKVSMKVEKWLNATADGHLNSK
jgi:uncharacterized membrane protein YfcA